MEGKGGRDIAVGMDRILRNFICNESHDEKDIVVDQYT